jgi:hypothetical protein
VNIKTILIKIATLGIPIYSFIVKKINIELAVCKDFGKSKFKFLLLECFFFAFDIKDIPE